MEAKRKLHWAWVILGICFVNLFVNYSARLWRGVAGDDPHPGFWQDRRRIYFPREIMATVIGAWTPFYGLGAILTHWITGMLRDATGVYYHAFFINMLMAAVGMVLMCFVRRNETS